MGFFRWMIGFILLVVGASYGITYAHANSGKGMKHPEHVSTNNYDYIIDIRKRKEYHIDAHPNAINIPMSKLRKKIQLKVENKNSWILVYGQTGSRARIAAERLRNLGYTNVHYLVGDFGDIEKK
jgi:rhodanese-related sulfurtransferase